MCSFVRNTETQANFKYFESKMVLSTRLLIDFLQLLDEFFVVTIRFMKLFFWFSTLSAEQKEQLVDMAKEFLSAFCPSKGTALLLGETRMLRFSALLNVSFSFNILVRIL